MATWALYAVVVFCAWVLAGVLIGLWLGWASRHYPPPDDESPYERRWTPDDGDEP